MVMMALEFLREKQREDEIDQHPERNHPAEDQFEVHRASQPVTGKQVQAANRKKTEADREKDSIEHGHPQPTAN
jgi:hypothetical protein